MEAADTGVGRTAADPEASAEIGAGDTVGVLARIEVPAGIVVAGIGAASVAAAAIAVGVVLKIGGNPAC